MQEAFRQAMRDLDAERQPATVDPNSLRVIQAALANSSDADLPASGPVEELCFVAEKLGRQWATYTNPGRTQPQEKEHLQDEWTLLIRQFVPLGREQQVQILHALVLGMGFGSPSGDSRKRRYLREQAQLNRKQFTEWNAIPGLAVQLPVVFVLHTIEELANCREEERGHLHALIAAKVVDRSQGDILVLLELVAAWLVARDRLDLPEEPESGA